MKIEIICPYCQAINEELALMPEFQERITCDDSTGASGCGGTFWVEAKATQWTLDYYTNFTKGI
jgi:hypothetical protein